MLLPLVNRCHHRTESLTALAETRDRLTDLLSTEQDAAGELAGHRKELRRLARAEQRRAERLAADEDDDGEVLDVDDEVDEREQDQLETHLLPDAEEKYATAKADREAAVADAKEQLGEVLAALREFDDR